ncbi:MAG: HDIG domain-containing protein [marine benthic group bacterium]|nr:HDIG domain-containing protein [Candidatus Benthicola marisminoris]
MTRVPSRAEALDLMHEYTGNENLRKHMYAVEAAMRAYAAKYGEDADLWGVTGLIHDFDYEKFPNDALSPTEEHPSSGVAILRENGWPEEILHAVMAHAEHTGVEPETLMARTLRAVDELTGFVTACALVRPTGISDLRAKSVKKKLKDRSFAAAVNREEIRSYPEAIGEDMTEHIDFVIEAMRGIADTLELQGHA